MINKAFKIQITKAALAIILVASLPAASLPAPVLADPVQAEGEADGQVDGQTDGQVDAQPEDNLETIVDDLLAAGEYEEGRVLALCDNYAGSSDESLVGGNSDKVLVGDSSNEPLVGGSESSVLSMATVVDTVSGGSYTAASGEVLEPVYEEELVGSSSEGGLTDAYDKDRVSILLIEDPEKSTRELLEEVLSDPAVLYAQPDYLHEIDGMNENDAGIDADLVEEDPTSSPETSVGTVTIPDLTGFQWEHAGSALIPKTEFSPEDIYNVHTPLWNEEGLVNSEGIVAVLDTGVDYTHPDLQGAMYEFPSELQEMLSCGPHGINVSGDGDPCDPMDYNGHGTHCSGIIAGEWNGTGISGAASGCQIMAVRLANDKGQMSDLAIVKGMTFVADAVDDGVDIRVTNNSYSGKITSVLIGTELAELEERGVVCVYSSGNAGEYNDIINSTSNMMSRASNTVVVNAATALRNKAGFTNCGEGMTDLFAPGASILSTITTQRKADKSKIYDSSLDSAAYYYNTVFKEAPIALMTEESYVTLHYDTPENYYSFDADGHSMRVTVDATDGEVSAFSFYIDIPVGSRNDVPYVSMAMYIPGGQYTLQMHRVGTAQDGNEVRDSSLNVTVNGNWSFLSCSGVPDLVAEGAAFPMITHENDSQNYVRVMVDVFKTEGSFQKNDVICIDRIGAGANADALLPYAVWDGTSMACPQVTAEAIILYNGLERSKDNAVNIVRNIKSKVVYGETLESCTSHGAMDMDVAEDEFGPIVENATCDKAKKTITITGCNFGSGGTVSLSGTDTEIVDWSGEKIVIDCPETMISGVQIIQVTNAVGTGSGRFLLYAPDASKDQATPLYETDIPDIPEELFPEGCLIKATVGLNDRIYVFIADHFAYEFNYADKVLRYSVTDKSWESIPDMPVSLCDLSVTGYRGKLLVTGSQADGENCVQKTLEYSPAKAEWTELDLQLPDSTSVINVNGTVYSVGGYGYDGTDKAVSEKKIMALDIPNKKTAIVGNLQQGLENGYVASDGQAIYVSGGYTRSNGKRSSSTERLEKITFKEDGTAVSAEVESPFKYQASPPYFINEFITGYRKVYLTGYVGAAVFEEETEAAVPAAVKSRTYTDPNGMTVLDEDTFALTDNQFLPYGKRISYDNLCMVYSTEYKGELYAFGSSIFEGDEYLNLVSRSTKVGDASAPVWDTFTVKVPEAKDLVYNGTQLTGISESKEGYYTVTGNMGTDPGTYTATLKLTDPEWCIWEDGTYEDKVLNWKITEGPTAAPTVTEVPTVTVIPNVTARATITPRPKASTAASNSAATKSTVTPRARTTVSSTSSASSKSSSGTSAKATSSVKTGDRSQPILWICVAAVAVVLILIVFRRNKK